jgi:hypothetical protein
MFLRSIHRKKDGKDHRYFSIVENQRIASNKTVQRTVLYLGEINDQQQATWRKTLSVFDDEQQEYANLSLFPDDREIPADAVDSLQVKLSGLELRRPRLFGSCWLGCQLWQQLGLHEFWDARLTGTREEVPWEKVLQLLVVSQLLDPGSEFRVHHQWYLTTAMDALLGTLAARPGVDTDGGAGKVGRHQNDRCLDSYGRSTLVDSASLHTACSRHEIANRETEIAAAQPAATAPYRAKTEPRNRGTHRPVGERLW